MEQHIEYQKAPALGRVYRRAVFGRRRGLDNPEEMPALSVAWKGIRPDPAHLTAYREICSIPDSGSLPLLYPYVLIGVLHLDLLGHPLFPFRLIGMVHSRQHVLQRRPISPTEALDAMCRIVQARAVKAGLEFDVSSFISSGSEPVYECVSTYLARGNFGEPGDLPPRAKIPPVDRPDASLQATWAVPGGTGRRYARVCYDYNPIHLWAITARLFGFQKAIAHGMWSAAKCLAALPPLPESQPLRADFAFKGPVFTASQVMMRVQREDAGYGFDLYCDSNPRPCIVGALSFGPLKPL